MKSNRETVKVIVLLILLFALTALPIVIMSIQNSAVMEKVSRVPVREEESSLNVSLSIEKKLEIMNTASENDKAVEVNEIEENTDLMTEAKEQLSKLSELNVIPNLNYSADCEVERSYKLLYIDEEDPRNIVTVKEWRLNYGEFNVWLNIDVNTFDVYSFSIDSESLDFYESFKTFSPSNLIDYLGLEAEKVKIKGDEYSGMLIVYLGTKKVQFEYFFDQQQIIIWF